MKGLAALALLTAVSTAAADPGDADLGATMPGGVTSAESAPRDTVTVAVRVPHDQPSHPMLIASVALTDRLQLSATAVPIELDQRDELAKLGVTIRLGLPRAGQTRFGLELAAYPDLWTELRLAARASRPFGSRVTATLAGSLAVERLRTDDDDHQAAGELSLGATVVVVEGLRVIGEVGLGVLAAEWSPKDGRRYRGTLGARYQRRIGEVTAMLELLGVAERNTWGEPWDTYDDPDQRTAWVSLALRH